MRDLFACSQMRAIVYRPLSSELSRHIYVEKNGIELAKVIDVPRGQVLSFARSTMTLLRI